ncbi:MAG TPA: hypothetical protein PLA35_04890 [Caldisericia bacterium]|nr:hypothetical protein [Caldisericia bacterium]
MKKILIGLLILGLIGVTLYGLFKFSNKNRESEVKEHYLPVVVGEEIKLYDIKSNSLSSIPGNPEAEVVFGESVDGKWLIISEGKREVAPGPSPDFFLSGWNLYRVNKETGEKLPIVLDKNVIVAVRSPKEDLIAYVTHTNGLWLVNLDGENKRQVVPDNIVMEFNILYGIRTPMIHWSPDGKKIGFSTFPEDWDGSDMWMNAGIGFYFLDKDEFILLTAYDLLKTIGFYSVEDKSFKDYSYLKGNPDDPIDGDLCLADYRCRGWFDKDIAFIEMGQSSNICGLTSCSLLLMYNLNEGIKSFFDYSILQGGSSLRGIKVDGDNIYLLILNQESGESIYQDLWLIKLTKEFEILEQKKLVKDLNPGFWARFTSDGRIIYENRDGRLVIINLDGSNPIVLPPEVKPPIYFPPYNQ